MTEIFSYDSEDSIVCYCYRLTTRDLKEAYKKCGSLKILEQTTRAGTGCGGCKVVMQSLFGEAPSGQHDNYLNPSVGTACSKPGSKFMKGFIIHDDNIFSRVYSSNAVAPQLGNCDTEVEIEYSVIDHRGVPLFQRQQTLKTNETFTFDTRLEELPKPFYGMFMLHINRMNFGAARFNIYWSNKNGTTSTHELGGTGRPRVYLPIMADKRFLKGPNTVFLALQNPYLKSIPFRISTFDINSREEILWKSELQPYSSAWINANEYLYKPALEKFKESRVAIKLENENLDVHSAVTVYFFSHNRNADLWSANHL